MHFCKVDASLLRGRTEKGVGLDGSIAFRSQPASPEPPYWSKSYTVTRAEELVSRYVGVPMNFIESAVEGVNTTYAAVAVVTALTSAVSLAVKLNKVTSTFSYFFSYLRKR